MEQTRTPTPPENTVPDRDRPAPAVAEPDAALDKTHLTDVGAPAAAAPAPDTSDRTTADSFAESDTPLKGSKGKIKLEQLGDFLLLQKLGEGGTGKVFRAKQVSLDREVAVKVLAKHLARDETFVQRFQREARVMAKLDHPHVLHCIAVGQEHKFHYLAMEYAENGSLGHWIKKLGRLEVGDAVHVALAIADALHYAHELGLVHRDVKPDNVLISGKGAAKLADLGLAKAHTDDLMLTRTGAGVGTPVYMSPEQTRDSKSVDARTDIFSLGCMLYCCLTGRAPFPGETFIEIFEAKQKGQYTPARLVNDAVPPKLDAIISRMLAPNPKLRYQECGELIRDLEALNLASPALSFIDAAAGTTRTPRKTASRPTVADIPAASTPLEPIDSDSWYVRCLNFDGVKRLTRKQIMDLIQDDNFDQKAEASRTPRGDFRAIGSYREFEGAWQSRVAKQHARTKASRYRTTFDKIAEEDDEYKRQRKIRSSMRWMGSWVMWVLCVALVLGGSYALYKFVLKPWFLNLFN